MSTTNAALPDARLKQKNSEQSIRESHSPALIQKGFTTTLPNVPQINTQYISPQLNMVHLSQNNNSDDGGVEDDDLPFKTPVDKSAPFFQSVNTLPTPMIYTPKSPTSDHCTYPPPLPSTDGESQIFVGKKRQTSGGNVGDVTSNHVLNSIPNRLDTIISSNTNQQSQPLRVISELPPFPNGFTKRVVSLPMVAEDLNNSGTISSSSKENFSILENSQEEVGSFGSRKKGKHDQIIEEEEEEGEDAGNDSVIITSNVDSTSTSTSKLEEDELVGYLLEDLVNPLHWRKVKQIGVGNFSNVHLYESLDQSYPYLNQVAVKRIKYPPEITDPQFKNSDLYIETLSRLENSLTRELYVLKSIQHPCIVQFYGVNNPIFIESKKPLTELLKRQPTLSPCDIILSYCSGGDLLAAASSCMGKLNKKLIQRIFVELVLAVKYLHENAIIHRDLKLENILLRFPIESIENGLMELSIYYQQNITQLTDFGLCKKLEDQEMCTARCGSEDYVCPEILMGIPYDGYLSDTWALGVILYGLLEDRLPFDPPPNANVRQRNRSTSHRIARFEWRWFNMVESDSPAKDIVKNTLTRKSTRWSIQQIYESPYIQEMLDSLEFIPKT
ncbi:hypothetical protein TBLA_0I01310 [Henningerozyma blattae CBS 6284]|uniref:Protein kinase domain-containing protein n=1 Tax=Henningerozyma blattae (strain ATCC 34711 / CBS 6284 / DSM 70876 / NBRC 10599 / NRRL Y-10934 / UCD 77-7) TaxID=1071380 RepID=I2H8T9_HENB6|nr:hypothetical protein TBLA_0I01310 [Tetrapisispora blattae CBS 6284]CCH62791.1 hypothetical protein TBLA_0I01310 [Tetrapisispora blattae CBS 6284]